MSDRRNSFIRRHVCNSKCQVLMFIIFNALLFVNFYIVD
jgi:hypothetical protein